MNARQLQARRPVSPAVRIRRSNLLWALIIGVFIGCAVYAGLIWLSDSTERLADRVYGGYPRCTDAIADAGGICYGEPLPPCPTEDSDHCYWDARTMGNGLGESFVNP